VFAGYDSMKPTSELLPKQLTGNQTNFTHIKKFENLKAAHVAFLAAAARLLSINNWDIDTGQGSAKFVLCNNQGKAIEEMAGESNFISIDLPGPGPKAGDGLEWVVIERIFTKGDEHTAEEYLLVAVRPITNPQKTGIEIAQFYNELSTGTFIIRRDVLSVSAGAHGRNESPNNDAVGFFDKVRNIAIAIAASVGLAGPQWQRFVEG
jgi:hypothetical protein